MVFLIIFNIQAFQKMARKTDLAASFFYLETP